MSYLEEFLESMRFASELNGVNADSAHDYEALGNYYLTVSKNIELAQFVRTKLSQLAHTFVRNAPYEVVNLCHSMSQQFFERATASGLTNYCGLAITIGNVEYNGKSLYPTSREHVADTLSKGVAPDQPLNLHVWLTTVNMFVIDLTIIPTLISRGIAKPNTFKGKDVLIAKNGMRKELRYRPLLHDDGFMYKVDRIAGVV